MPAPLTRRIILLGSTGSIGTQTLDVIAHLNRLAEGGAYDTRFEVVGLAAGRNAELLAKQCAEFNVRDAALTESGANSAVAAYGTRLRTGSHAPEHLVREVECDIVLGAMVGSAGLPATLAAVSMGRDVALANKETLVAAGELVVPAAQASGARLLPVDSEHCGVWQALLGSISPQDSVPPLTCDTNVRRITLTASGGPFRTWSMSDTYNATPQQALKHPTWQMGAKVTVDSASLTNKALEVIEAHWLFGIGGDRIDVLVHPQSIVHALVEYTDGSILAHLGAPDMRSPIQYALTHPHRPEGACRKLDFAALRSLEFAPPDRERFPALDAAYEIISRGGTSGAVFNAANEVAVQAFLDGQIPFGRITELAGGALRRLGSSRLRTLADVLEADNAARQLVRDELRSTPVRA